MNIALPEEVRSIINTLEAAGYEGYAVGGCVRDSLLGVEPKDWDITSNATPDVIKKLFPITIDTGIEHGTVTVRIHKQSYEVTTYRTDGKYSDGRHPESVTFVPDLKEDLRRRDFTINAMAYNPRMGLVDLFGGCEDLDNFIIRCVDVPEKRFEEDALRMMRTLRFAAQLDFEIEPATEEAICKLAPNISMVSAERITDELLKIICSPRPHILIKASKMGLTKQFFPEWDIMLKTEQNNPHHMTGVGEHTILVMQRVAPTKQMRLSALLHDVAKPVCKKTDIHGVDHFLGHPGLGAEMAQSILKRFKMDNDTIGFVKKMVRFHDERPTLNKRNIRRAANRMGQDVLEYIFEFQRADILGQSGYMQQEKLERIDEFERLYREILEEQNAIYIKDLKIKGSRVIELGVPKGPLVGEVLKTLLEDVMECPSHNDEEYLEQRVTEIIHSYGK